MFELPIAKRIRRQDLYSTSPSPAPSTSDFALRARLQQQYEAVYQLSPSAKETVNAAITASIPSPAVGNVPAQEEEAFEFRLFSKPVLKPNASDQAPNKPSRVFIRSPSPVAGEPGFVQPRRSDNYYFASAPTSEERACFEAASISADAIIAEQARRWPGCALPWRVKTINLATRNTSEPIATAGGSSAHKKRAGKKRRIILRKKLVLVRQKEAVASMTAAERAAAEREKRTRRNREKKVKKKERNKLKKMTEPTVT